MVSLEARGWELVVSNVAETLIPSFVPRVRRVVRISEGRYSLELPLEPAPERLLAELTAAGARLVSLNPIRDTLEDIFLKRVSTAALRAQS
jgi:hypothetical protein